MAFCCMIAPGRVALKGSIEGKSSEWAQLPAVLSVVSILWREEWSTVEVCISEQR